MLIQHHHHREYAHQYLPDVLVGVRNTRQDAASAPVSRPLIFDSTADFWHLYIGFVSDQILCIRCQICSNIIFSSITRLMVICVCLVYPNSVARQRHT